MEKVCGKCKQSKSLELFSKSPTHKFGVHNWCKECFRAYSNQDYRLKRAKRLEQGKAYRDHNKPLVRKFIQEVKQNRGCSLCDEKEFFCIDFHHLDPTEKSIQVSNFTNSNAYRLIKEMEKCICVCSNCHRKIHAGVLDCSHVSVIQLSDEEKEKFLSVKKHNKDTLSP